MKFEELLEFIESFDQKLIEKFDKNTLTQRERVLSRAVKLTEEMGELSNDILSTSGDQRDEKLKDYDKDNLSEEFADVIITTLLLAKSMDIDIEKGLENKIKKINKRYG